MVKKKTQTKPGRQTKTNIHVIVLAAVSIFLLISGLTLLGYIDRDKLPLVITGCDPKDSTTAVIFNYNGAYGCEVIYRSACGETSEFEEDCQADNVQIRGVDSVKVQVKSVRFGLIEGLVKARPKIDLFNSNWDTFGTQVADLPGDDYDWRKMEVFQEGINCEGTPSDSGDIVVGEYDVDLGEGFTCPMLRYWGGDNCGFNYQDSNTPDYLQLQCLEGFHPNPNGWREIQTADGLLAANVKQNVNDPHENSDALGFTMNVQIIDGMFLTLEDEYRATIPTDLHYRPYDCPIPSLPEQYTLMTETRTGTVTADSFKWDPNYFCGKHPVIEVNQWNIQTRTHTDPYIDIVDTGSTLVPEGSTYIFHYVIPTSRTWCKLDEVRTLDGTCSKAIRECADNGQDHVCDPNMPTIWCLDANENGLCDPTERLCRDDEGDGICNVVEDLFCLDTNKNQMCDWSELFADLTLCEDENANNICDVLETTGVSCDPDDIQFVCGDDGLTYPNACFADIWTNVNTTGKCSGPGPIVITRDCTNNQAGCPSGYDCIAPGQGEALGAVCLRDDSAYQELCTSDSDCESEYTCAELGVTGDSICTRTIIVDRKIDCLTTGCPEGTGCIGGICQGFEVGDCRTGEINCGDYTDPITGEPLACNEFSGYCVGDRYIESTCVDDGIECPPDSQCIETTEGRGVCLQRETIYGECRPNCNNQQGICNGAMGEICRYEDGVCVDSQYIHEACDVIGCPCDEQTCVNKVCVNISSLLDRDCRTDGQGCPPGWACTQTNVWSEKYACLRSYNESINVSCIDEPTICPDGYTCVANHGMGVCLPSDYVDDPDDDDDSWLIIDRALIDKLIDKITGPWLFIILGLVAAGVAVMVYLKTKGEGGLYKRRTRTPTRRTKKK